MTANKEPLTQIERDTLIQRAELMFFGSRAGYKEIAFVCKVSIRTVFRWANERNWQARRKGGEQIGADEMLALATNANRLIVELSNSPEFKKREFGEKLDAILKESINNLSKQIYEHSNNYIRTN